MADYGSIHEKIEQQNILYVNYRFATSAATSAAKIAASFRSTRSSAITAVPPRSRVMMESPRGARG
jgi:hypothetical protein